MRTRFVLFMALGLSSCRAVLDIKTNFPARAFQVVQLKPQVYRPGDRVPIKGEFFFDKMHVLIAGVEYPVEYPKDSEAELGSETDVSFILPTGAVLLSAAGTRSGKLAVNMKRNDRVVALDHIYLAEENDFPLYAGDASKICDSEQFYNAKGELSRGTKVCNKPDCTEDGQVECVATKAVPAFLATNLAKKIAVGDAIASVKGEAALIPSCAANAVVGCVTTTTYKSADLTNLTATNIKAGVSIAGVAGTVSESPANCSSPGAQSCVATGTYFAGTVCSANSSACYLPNYVLTTQPLKAISFDAISSGLGSIRTSLTLATLSGTLVDCNTNNTLGCVTAGSYKSADWTNLTAANIKNAVVIAGLTGTYPSSGNLLAGSTATADLDLATFDAKIKSSTAFEWFGPDGVNYSYAGDADITDANILLNKTVFGLTGTLNGATSCTTTVQATCQADSACTWNGSFCSVNTWNIRYGIILNGSMGALKTNCKNRMNSSIYNSVATPPGNSAITGGAANDWWDTIDDYNNNLVFPTTLVASFNAETDCSYTNWQDVTTDGICDSAADDCMMKDRITGLIWSESYPVTGAAATSTTADWSAAVNMCDILSYGGRIDWRLPTQKELTLAYVHGIRSVGYNGTGTSAGSTDNNVLFISDTDTYYWSASSQSAFPSDAWYVNLRDGDVYTNVKTSTYELVCVAP